MEIQRSSANNLIILIKASMSLVRIESCRRTKHVSEKLLFYGCLGIGITALQQTVFAMSNTLKPSSKNASLKSWISSSLETFGKLSEEDQDRAIAELISKCSIASRVRLSKFCYDFINQDFLVKLPLEVLEYVMNYLSVIDALVACHASPEWNENISMLHFAWRKKWLKLQMDSNHENFMPRGSWKTECERGVALLNKFPAQAMLNPSEDFFVKIHITTMDYCNDVLFCCGNPTSSDSINTIPKNIAYVFRKAKDWTLVTAFEVVPVRFCVLCCCLIPGFKILAGGHDGILTIWNLEVPGKDLPGSVTLIRAVQAHSSCIGSLCGNEELGIAVSAGRDSRLMLWDLNTGTRLRSFSTSRVCEVSILAGDKSPFIGYNCILVRKSGERCTVAMACWGGNIPLEEALYAPVVLHSHEHDHLHGPSTILPNVFVQGGSLVYGFRKFVSSLRTETCKLIWQTLDPDDFITGESHGISNEELLKFRESLHPCRKDRVISLPQDTIGIQAVGLCFSVVLCNNSSSLFLVVNETGNVDKLLDACIIFNKTDESGKMADTQWLDGIDRIQPGSTCFVRVIGQERIVAVSWRQDVFEYQKLSVSDLMAIRDRTSGLLASNATITEGLLN